MGFRFWIVVGGLLGALGVIIGAMGSHVFAEQLQGNAAVFFEKAWRYHMIHVPAILFSAFLIWVFDHGLETHGSWSARLAAGFFLLGILLFSGVLYLQALAGGEPKIPVVPVGGISLILGWVMLILSGMRLPRF